MLLSIFSQKSFAQLLARHLNQPSLTRERPQRPPQPPPCGEAAQPFARPSARPRSNSSCPANRSNKMGFFHFVEQPSLRSWRQPRRRPRLSTFAQILLLFFESSWKSPSSASRGINEPSSSFLSFGRRRRRKKSACLFHKREREKILLLNLTPRGPRSAVAFWVMKVAS